MEKELIFYARVAMMFVLVISLVWTVHEDMVVAVALIVIAAYRTLPRLWEDLYDM